MIVGVGADNVSITEPLQEVVPSVGPDAARIDFTFTHYGLDEVMLGIEGAVFFLRATTQPGEVVLDRIVDPRDAQRLPFADYKLTAYYRTCGGNCAHLDMPREICSAEASIGNGGNYELEVNVKDGECRLAFDASMLRVGVAYEIEVPTLCGLRGTYLNGDPWVVDGEPMSGFLTPTDHGSVRLEDSGRAVYTSELGVTFTLIRVEVLPSMVPCF